MQIEHYKSIHCASDYTPFDAIQHLRDLFMQYARNGEFKDEALVFLRFFCSDVYTHAVMIEKLWPNEDNTQRIYIGQAPLDSAYISLQAYIIQGAEKSRTQDGSLLVRHGQYESLWTLDYPYLGADSQAQTAEVIGSMTAKLAEQGMTPAQNLLRTWYYVRDVDNNYSGMVRERVAAYEASGLGPNEHFVASTGIEANSPNPHNLVALHACSVRGLEPGQIAYLKALSHLSPTNDYGVNFERATKVIYGDRVHCHISGTASIDHRGAVLHIGNVARQFDRAVENIEALLDEGAMKLEDMKCATIYLRDPWDYRIIKNLVKDRLPKDCAVNITHGAVCRPDWLVEIEGEVIAPFKSEYPDFV